MPAVFHHRVLSGWLQTPPVRARGPNWFDWDRYGRCWWDFGLPIRHLLPSLLSYQQVDDGRRSDLIRVPGQNKGNTGEAARRR